jgi:glutaredoxin 3
MSKIKIYGNESCAYCGAARMLLTKKGFDFEDILISRDAAKRAEMEALSSRSSVPQVFVGDRHIGGFDELCELDKRGELDKILAG